MIAAAAPAIIRARVSCRLPVPGDGSPEPAPASVAARNAADAAPYRPLARLMANRLMEQRKLEESLVRHAQQLREQQRRIEQLNERLEAMRAIERSLNNRAPARPAAP